MNAVKSSVSGFSNSNFVQQRLWSWRPLFSPIFFIIIDSIITLFFFIVGALTFISNENIKDAAIRYDDKCSIGQTCTVTLNVKEKIEGDINFYYKLTNFHQNQRRYVISRSDGQLAGEYVSYDDMENCKPLRGVNDDPNQLLLPCGLAAMTFFNDTFTFQNQDYNNAFSDTDIAWESDVDHLFKPLNSQYVNGTRYLEENYATTFPGGQTNQHFIVWMRNAALPTFIKLYSKCHGCTIEKGDVNVIIQNNYPLDGFHGEKWIVISRKSNIGTKNPFFAIACFVIGSIAVIALVLMVILVIISPRKIGDKDLIEKMIMEHSSK